MSNPKLKKAMNYIDSNRENMLKLWETLVNIESGPDNVEGINAVQAIISDELHKDGFNNQIIKSTEGPNILISKNCIEGQKESICLIGHVDTVFKRSSFGPNPFHIVEGKAYGPGVLDMKGGVVIATYAMKALKYAGYDDYSLKMILAPDEEIGHPKTDFANIAMNEFKDGKAAFNFETGFLDDGLVLGRKGAIIFDLVVTGIPAHTGNAPQKGRNAIAELAHKVIEFENMTDYEKGTFSCVGLINGGKALNIVPDHAVASVSIRYSKVKDKEEIIAKIDELASKVFIEGTTTQVVYRASIDPMEVKDNSLALLEIVKKSAASLDLAIPHALTVGGISDSVYPVLAGLPTICAFGPKGENNHRPDEYAIVESLFERAHLFLATVMNLS